MNITYGISEAAYSLDNDSRISYGIVAYSNTETDGTATVLLSINDITSDKASLTALVNKCNLLEVSTVHIRDIIDDFLATL